MFRKFAALTAASLLMASSAAVAQSVPVTDSPAVRASAETEDASRMDGGGYTIWIIGAVVVALLIWGGIELFGDDDEDPISP